MGIFSRIADLFSANVNHMIDKAENPEIMIKHMVIEMQEALTKATSGLAQAMAQEKQLERAYEKFNAQSKDWEQKAVQALGAGREDLARKALEQKNLADQQGAEYKKMFDNAKATTDKLRAQVNELKAKIDEAKAKEQTLIARSQTADAQKQIAKHLNTYDTSGVFSKFDKFEQKILAKESEADALTDLNKENSSLDNDFKQLSSKAGVDDELALLKAKMNLQ